MLCGIVSQKREDAIQDNFPEKLTYHVLAILYLILIEKLMAGKWLKKTIPINS
jgi:hypothetical protein